MFRLMLACVLLAGCTPPTPITVVQVPGMTPLPLAQREISSLYERDAFIRQCSNDARGAYSERAKNLVCGCMLDTMTVYLTLADARAYVRKYGNGPTGLEAATRDGASTPRIIRACRAEVLGE